ILQKLGLIGDKTADVAEMIEVLEGMLPRLEERSPLRNNPAKQLSQRLYGQLPVVYGAGIASGGARRWKTQINENSKAWSFHEVFPELNHNAAAGYLLPRELVSRVRVVLLRAPSSGERMRLRYEITCELLRQAGVAHELVDGEGKGALAQMMSLVMMGDFTSYYLAMLYGVDPSPLKVISYLKERLARS
ncbi:MAG: bifunctional phosphoglucose/phosphomannose isomerase, partial [Dehalococcoidales bacterium]|nr:bifunctional phosphoglucose/phosphomannose isomerase [Dehalococcoidales bacterium]